MGIQSEKTKRLTTADINAFSSAFDTLVSSFVMKENHLPDILKNNNL